MSHQPANLNQLLASLKPALAHGQRGYLALQLTANLSLWLWFYFATRWLAHYVTQQRFDLAAFHISLAMLIFFALVKFLAISQRQKLNTKVSELFYQRFFNELAHKRWALIRTKPLSAWQDASFRHLPAIEQYLIDYQTQRQLVAVLPLISLLLVLPFSWLVALTLLLTLPLIPLFMWLVGAGTASAKRKHNLALNRLGAVFADRILGQSTVRVLHDQQRQLAQFEHTNRYHNQRLAEVLRLAFLSSSVLDFFSTVAIALVAVFIGFALLEEVQFGFYAMVPSLHHSLFLLLLAPAFFAEFKALGKLYHVKAEAMASAEFWAHCLTWQPRPLNPQPQAPALTCIELKQAQVAGFEGTNLLNIAQLNIHAGDRIHLTGVSGAGKTLLLDALAGLRSLTGQIHLNGKQANQLTKLLPKVFYLAQRPVIFEASLRYNLGLGHCDDQTLLNALEAVNLAGWLAEQPLGLATPISETANLSGGQQQKLALARAIIFNAELILLDEPFTHLTQAEQTELEQLMHKITQGRMSIWVSHRPLLEASFDQHWHINGHGQLVVGTQGARQ